MGGTDIRELQGIDLAALDTAALDALVLEVESLSRQLAAFRQNVVTQVDAAGVAFERGYTSTAAYLRDVLRISPHAASGLVHAARSVGPRRALTGEVLEPIYPTVAAAQHAGEISPEHAAVIVRTIDRLPDDVAALHDRAVEADLVAHAKQFDPSKLRRLARHVTECLNPDGRFSDPAYRERTRGLDIRVNADGSSRIEGDLTAECTELLLTVRDSLGKPVTTDSQPDVRSHRQRTHDALRDALRITIRSGRLPAIAGVTATIVLTMSAEAYATSEGHATTGHGYRIPATTAKDWAGADHEVIAVVLDKTRRVEAHSSTHRTYTRS